MDGINEKVNFKDNNIGQLFVQYDLFVLMNPNEKAIEQQSKWVLIIIYLIPKNRKDTATTIGTYSAFQSICTKLASSLTGLIWYQYGANTTFIITGCLTMFVIL